MNKSIMIVAENWGKFSAQQIEQAFNGRYGKCVESIDINDVIITMEIPNRVFKMVEKFAPKKRGHREYEKAILKIVNEDFSDEFDQVFEDGVWVE